MKTLIRVPNWIGDAVMATPAVQLIAQQNPEGGLGIWGPTASTTLFRNFPGVIALHEIPRENPENLLPGIREAGYGQVFLFTNSFSSAREARNAGIPRRVGYRRDWRGPLLTHPVLCSPKTRSLHMVDYYLHLLPREWRTTNPERIPRLYLSDEEIRQGKEMLQKFTQGISRPVVGVAAGAAYGSAKQWESGRFQETLAELSRCGCFIVTFGTEKDQAINEMILSKCHPGRGNDLAGKTDIRGLMGLIASCSCLLSNDSGPMHLADALGTPVVALFGSTDSGWTGPQGKQHRIFQSEVACNPCFLRECPIDRACMKSFSTEAVLAAVKSVLELPSEPAASPDI